MAQAGVGSFDPLIGRLAGQMVTKTPLVRDRGHKRLDWPAPLFAAARSPPRWRQGRGRRKEHPLRCKGDLNQCGLLSPSLYCLLTNERVAVPARVDQEP